jgi:hypothetical protein
MYISMVFLESLSPTQSFTHTHTHAHTHALYVSPPHKHVLIRTLMFNPNAGG